MAKYTTWIKKKDGKVAQTRQVSGDKSPGEGWEQVPNDWLNNTSKHQGGRIGDDLSFFNNEGYRIHDTELIAKKKLKDNRGRWYHKEKIGQSIQVFRLGDPKPGEEWTREEPIKNESYQKWDSKKEKFIIDMAAKAEAEKKQRISEKEGAIQTVEQRKLRSLIARMEGIATEEDERYYKKYTEEINKLRHELNEIRS